MLGGGDDGVGQGQVSILGDLGKNVPEGMSNGRLVVVH